MEKIVIIGGNGKSKSLIKTMMKTGNEVHTTVDGIINHEDTLPKLTMPVGNEDIHYYEEIGDYIHPTKKQLENMKRKHK